MLFPLSTPKERQIAKDYIDALPFPSDSTKTRYFANITRKSPKRTLDQNRLYWLWITCICVETGNERDDVHEELKRMFLGKERYKVFDKIHYRTRSTSDLTTLQFTHYLEKVQIFANTELNIILPNPEDQYWHSFEERYLPYM